MSAKGGNRTFENRRALARPCIRSLGDHTSARRLAPRECFYQARATFLRPLFTCNVAVSQDGTGLRKLLSEVAFVSFSPLDLVR
jgi:hypothetical protein